MREIKFRIWDDANNHMFFTRTNSYDESFVTMQYTGLKDKNGKEIYEGDVIKQEDHTYPVMAIEYHDAIGGWNYSYRNGEYMVAPDREWEVIGNIFTGLLKEYENPDIIETWKKHIEMPYQGL